MKNSALIWTFENPFPRCSTNNTKVFHMGRGGLEFSTGFLNLIFPYFCASVQTSRSTVEPGKINFPRDSMWCQWNISNFMWIIFMGSTVLHGGGHGGNLLWCSTRLEGVLWNYFYSVMWNILHSTALRPTVLQCVCGTFFPTGTVENFLLVPRF